MANIFFERGAGRHIPVKESDPGVSFVLKSIIMQHLTAEQEQVLSDVVLGNHCCVVTAVPGAGKTTLAIELARRCTGANMLVITYNKVLELALSDKVGARGVRNLTASTIHGLLGRQSSVQCSDDIEMLTIVEQVESGECRLQALDADIVIIDEAQDLRPLFVRAIQAVLRTRRKDVCMVVCGDTSQMLYDFKSLGADAASSIYMEDAQTYFGFACGTRSWTRRVLTMSFRLTPNMAEFINVFWDRPDPIVGANDRSPNKPVNLICLNPYDSHTIPALIKASVNRYGRENVLLVGQSTKGNTPTCHQSNLMETPVHIKEGGSGGVDKNELIRKSHVLNLCQSKGAEYKCVWFIGFSVYRLNTMMSINQVCVGLSRGSAELNVVLSDARRNPQLIYPIGGRMERIEETYERVDDLMRRGVVLSNCKALPRGQLLPCIGPKRTNVTESTRVCAEDLRTIRAMLSGTKPACHKVDTSLGKMRYMSGRAFHGLHYDVSGLYGDAIPFAFQASRGVAPPNILKLVLYTSVPPKPSSGFTHAQVIQGLANDGATMHDAEFRPYEGRVDWKTLEQMLQCTTIKRGPYVVPFKKHNASLQADLRNARAVCLESGGVHVPRKSAVWLYLASMCRASEGFRNRFKYMGRTIASYNWYADELFDEAVRMLDAVVPSGGTFEYPLAYTNPHAHNHVLQGNADWVSDTGAIVYELKFVSALSDEHRFQTQLYGAMLAVERACDATSTLVNVRTGEMETYRISLEDALSALPRLVSLHA